MTRPRGRWRTTRTLELQAHRNRLDRVASGMRGNAKGDLVQRWDAQMRASEGARMEIDVGHRKLLEQQGIDIGSNRRLDTLDPKEVVELTAEERARLVAKGHQEKLIDELGDSYERGEVREVKSGSVGSDDVDRLKAYLELVRAKPKAIIDGMEVEKLVLVLYDPKKALGNGELKTLIEKTLGRDIGFAVELVEPAGVQRFERAKDWMDRP